MSAVSSPVMGRKPLERPHRLAWPFLVVILLLQFFPIPKLPGVNVAPENFVFLLCLLVMGQRLVALVTEGEKTTVVVVALVAFGVVDWVHDFFQQDLIGNPARHVRGAILLLLLAEVCAYPAPRLRLLKWVLVIGVVQVVFGSLVYFVGEPFVSVRNWMLQSAVQVSERMIGEGSQIASTYGAPHTFAYLLGSFPMLALGLYFAEKKWRWLLALSVLIGGLFLNAERAVAVLLVGAILVACWKSGQRARNMSIVLVLGVAFIGLQQVLIGLREDTNPVQPGLAYTSGGTLTDRFSGSTFEEVGDRLMYQLHGVVSVLKHPVLGPTPEEYAREVLGAGSVLVSDLVTAAVMAPHNHYVNAGVRAGLLGWFLMGWSLITLWQVCKRIRVATKRQGGGQQQLALCVILGFGVVIGNAIFHNAGLFSAELATIVVVGVLLGLYRGALREAARARRSRGSESAAAGPDGSDDEPVPEDDLAPEASAWPRSPRTPG